MYNILPTSYKITCMLSSIPAASEKCLNTLKKIKTNLQLTMSQERPSSIVIINFERQFTKKSVDILRSAETIVSKSRIE